MTQRALNILEAGGAGAYEGALAGLRDDTQEYWQECLSDRKRGLMAAYQSAYKMWDRSRRHSEDRQVSIKE